MTASKSILLRVSPQEHAEITSRASESGLSLSRFLVSRALGDAPATWATAPQHELAKARAALQAALRALEGADSAPAIVVPVLEVSEPVVVADSEAAIVSSEPVVEAIQDAPEVKAVVALSPPHAGDARPLLDALLDASERETLISIEWRNALVVAPTQVDPTQRGFYQYVGARRKIGAQVELPIGAPVLVLADVVTEHSSRRWRPDSKPRGKCVLVGLVAPDGLQWRRVFRASEEAVDLQRWVRSALATPLTPAEQAVAAELDEALATTKNPFDDMIF